MKLVLNKRFEYRDLPDRKDLQGQIDKFGGGGREALSQVLRDRRMELFPLLPEQADFRLDRDYVLFAAGFLRELDEEAAFSHCKAEPVPNMTGKQTAPETPCSSAVSQRQRFFLAWSA